MYLLISMTLCEILLALKNYKYLVLKENYFVVEFI